MRTKTIKSLSLAATPLQEKKMKVIKASFTAALVVIFSNCATSANKITIPPSDTSPPTVTMDVFLPNQSTPLTVLPTTAGTPTVTATANDVVTVAARGDDPDGGVQDVQIWALQTSWRLVSGTQQQVGPGLAGAPEASSPDPSMIGDVALKSRLATHNFDIKQLRGAFSRIRIEVWATAKNFHGGTVSTKSARIVWP
jgi:hypothetical protein